MATPVYDLLTITQRNMLAGRKLSFRQNLGRMETVGRIADVEVIFGKLQIRTTESQFRIDAQEFQPISIYTTGQNFLSQWVSDIEELRTEPDGTIHLSLVGGDILLVQP